MSVETAAGTAAREWFQRAAMNPVRMWAYFRPHGEEFFVGPDPPSAEWELLTAEAVLPSWTRHRVQWFLVEHGQRVPFHPIDF